MNKIIFCVLLTLISATAEDHSGHAHDKDHAHHQEAHQWAPIGVMGSHVHGEGEWMFSYRYMYMDMEGLRKGTDRVSQSDAQGSMMNGKYPMVPRRMTMKMHMLGAMYGATDDLTLTMMVPWLEKDMDSSSRMNGTGPENKFTTRADGFGDLKIGGLYRLYKGETHEFIFNLGLSLPTGSTTEEGKTSMSNGQELRLGYPMQLGSGTFDFMPGFTVTGHNDVWGWGSQLIATLRTGRNNQGYRQGDAVLLNNWVSRKLTKNLATSLRIELNSWSDYNGNDDALVGRKSMMPTADEDLRGGTRADVHLGFNYLFTEGALEDQNLALEIGVPFYQNLEGPNLETDYTVTLGWQVRF
jgi:hypothetical protein